MTKRGMSRTFKLERETFYNCMEVLQNLGTKRPFKRLFIKNVVYKIIEWRSDI